MRSMTTRTSIGDSSLMRANDSSLIMTDNNNNDSDEILEGLTSVVDTSQDQDELFQDDTDFPQ